MRSAPARVGSPVASMAAVCTSSAVDVTMPPNKSRRSWLTMPRKSSRSATALSEWTRSVSSERQVLIFFRSSGSNASRLRAFCSRSSSRFSSAIARSSWTTRSSASRSASMTARTTGIGRHRMSDLVIGLFACGIQHGIRLISCAIDHAICIGLHRGRLLSRGPDRRSIARCADPRRVFMAQSGVRLLVFRGMGHATRCTVTHV